MQPLDRLTLLLSELPGIGTRQARRLAFALLRKDDAYAGTFASALRDARMRMRVCPISYQCFFDDGSGEEISPIVRDSSRDHSTILIVEKDSDLEAVERTRAYQGQYFLIGQLAPLLDTDIQEHPRVRALEVLVESKINSGGFHELILGLPATPEGDRTAEQIINRIQPLIHKSPVRISVLGRGMSTGSELEYLDSGTMKAALDRRSSAAKEF
jgi:recombination protein RecR